MSWRQHDRLLYKLGSWRINWSDICSAYIETRVSHAAVQHSHHVINKTFRFPPKRLRSNASLWLMSAQRTQTVDLKPSVREKMQPQSVCNCRTASSTFCVQTRTVLGSKEPSSVRGSTCTVFPMESCTATGRQMPVEPKKSTSNSPNLNPKR